MFVFVRLFKFHKRCGMSVARATSRAAGTVWRDFMFTLRSPL